MNELIKSNIDQKPLNYSNLSFKSFCDHITKNENNQVIQVTSVTSSSRNTSPRRFIDKSNVASSNIRSISPTGIYDNNNYNISSTRYSSPSHFYIQDNNETKLPQNPVTYSQHYINNYNSNLKHAEGYPTSGQLTQNSQIGQQYPLLGFFPVSSNYMDGYQYMPHDSMSIRNQFITPTYDNSAMSNFKSLYPNVSANSKIEMLSNYNTYKPSNQTENTPYFNSNCQYSVPNQYPQLSPKCQSVPYISQNSKFFEDNTNANVQNANTGSTTIINPINSPGSVYLPPNHSHEIGHNLSNSTRPPEYTCELNTIPLNVPFNIPSPKSYPKPESIYTDINLTDNNFHKSENRNSPQMQAHSSPVKLIPAHLPVFKDLNLDQSRNSTSFGKPEQQSIKGHAMQLKSNQINSSAIDTDNNYNKILDFDSNTNSMTDWKNKALQLKKLLIEAKNEKNHLKQQLNDMTQFELEMKQHIEFQTAKANSEERKVRQLQYEIDVTRAEYNKIRHNNALVNFQESESLIKMVKGDIKAHNEAPVHQEFLIKELRQRLLKYEEDTKYLKNALATAENINLKLFDQNEVLRSTITSQKNETINFINDEMISEKFNVHKYLHIFKDNKHPTENTINENKFQMDVNKTKFNKVDYNGNENEMPIKIGSLNGVSDINKSIFKDTIEEKSKIGYAENMYDDSKSWIKENNSNIDCDRISNSSHAKNLHPPDQPSSLPLLTKSPDRRMKHNHNTTSNNTFPNKEIDIDSRKDFKKENINLNNQRFVLDEKDGHLKNDYLNTQKFIRLHKNRETFSPKIQEPASFQKNLKPRITPQQKNTN